MYLVYSIGLSLLFLALLPYFLYQSATKGKYLGSFKERLGRIPTLEPDGRPTIWIHAVSVGEFIAARPLISALRSEMPHHRIVVSTTTQAGQRLARMFFPDRLEAVFYFPFDWTFAVRRALNHIRPELVIIIETELWPNFLRQCRIRGVPAIVANGRLSQRSYSRYRIARRFISRVLDDISLLIMQSEKDAERARLLGASPDRVLVCGNLKYDIETGGKQPAPACHDLDRLDLFASGNLIVAGSTAPGEEEIVLEALRIVRATRRLENARLVIAPRHPERFDEVARLIARSEFTLARRSEATLQTEESTSGAHEPSPERGISLNSHPADVVLLDSIGELAAVYKHAAVVFVGGSLVPRGGHNIIEPAAFAKPIVVGPHMNNFRQVVSDFAAGNALVQIDGNSAITLAAEFIRLLSDTEAATALGARALDILDKSRGATECTLSAIRRATSRR